MKKKIITLFVLFLLLNSIVFAQNNKLSEMMIWLNAVLPIEQNNQDGLKNEFIIAQDIHKNISQNSEFHSLSVKKPQVFAGIVTDENKRILIVANLNFKQPAKVEIKIPQYENNNIILPIKVSYVPKIKNGKLKLDLSEGEVVVLILK